MKDGMTLKRRLLAIDKNEVKFFEFQSAWKQNGVSCIRVTSMQEAIELAARETFFIVGINADNINYLPTLSILRGLTKAHISVLTSNYTIQEDTKALDNGADFFTEWWRIAEESTQRGMAMAMKAERQHNSSKKDVEFKSYKNVLIHLNTMKVYLDGEIIDLTTQEYHLLNFFIENPKYVYSYEKIFENIWGLDSKAENDKKLLEMRSVVLG